MTRCTAKYTITDIYRITDVVGLDGANVTLKSADGDPDARLLLIAREPWLRTLALGDIVTIAVESGPTEDGSEL